MKRRKENKLSLTRLFEQMNFQGIFNTEQNYFEEVRGELFSIYLEEKNIYERNFTAINDERLDFEQILNAHMKPIKNVCAFFEKHKLRIDFCAEYLYATFYTKNQEYEISIKKRME